MQIDEKAANAVGEAWASIDGKLGHYEYERGMSAAKVTELDLTGHFLGYQAEAEELIRRIRKRGFDVVPTLTLGSRITLVDGTEAVVVPVVLTDAMCKPLHSAMGDFVERRSDTLDIDAIWSAMLSALETK